MQLNISHICIILSSAFLLAHINAELYFFWDLLGRKFNGKGVNEFDGTTIKDQKMKMH